MNVQIGARKGFVHERGGEGPRLVHEIAGDGPECGQAQRSGRSPSSRIWATLHACPDGLGGGVVCSSCGTDNPAGTRFCKECGTRLGTVCSACGTAILPDAKFCGACGTPVGAMSAARPATAEPATATPAAAPIAERRHVSVLFADLVGFTSLAEGRDAEETRELLSRYFDLARDVIGRYGGTVEKFIGDAVMAIWGAPVAHEDDAERAVRAALELVEAVGGLAPGVTARAGVLTGEAAVTLGATNQGMVAGDLVNTASRLQGVATPGTVLVGEVTEQAIRDSIVLEAVGEQALKGKVLPVPAWRALRVVAGRRGVGRADRLEAPFVGRAAELRALKDALTSTGAEHRARYVAITGQAGIGKSRLAWELEKYVDGLVEPIYWHRGRSPAYGEGIGFWALAEMVRSRAGILEGDLPSDAAVKLSTMLETYVPGADDRRWIEPHLRVLLGLEQSAGGDRSEQFAAWRRLFEAIAARGTTALVFEDLQWADDGLLDFIESLLEWSRSQPILVVVLARPELHERRPTLGAASRNALAVHLEPLEPGRDARAARRPRPGPRPAGRGCRRRASRRDPPVRDRAGPHAAQRRGGGIRRDGRPAGDPAVAACAGRGTPGRAAAGRSHAAAGRSSPGPELHDPCARGRERGGGGRASRHACGRWSGGSSWRWKPIRARPNAASTRSCNPWSTRSPTRPWRAGTGDPGMSRPLATSNRWATSRWRRSSPPTTWRHTGRPPRTRRARRSAPRRGWRSGRRPTGRPGSTTTGRR